MTDSGSSRVVFRKRETDLLMMLLLTLLLGGLAISLISSDRPQFILPKAASLEEKKCSVRVREHSLDSRYRLNLPNVHFPAIINDTMFVNREIFDFRHCPYSAKFIIDSNPLTHEKFCRFNSSRLEWPGRCRQVYRVMEFEEEDSNIDPIPSMISWNCIFEPKNASIFPESTTGPVVKKNDP